MSTMYPVIEIEYKKRKPSKAVIMRTLGEYLKQGGKAFTITWGENWIELDYHHNQEAWYASGSFNDNGLERIHHPITVGTRQYDLVLDCNDDGTAWDSFSFWDEKKQLYIDTAQGQIE